MAQIGTIGLDIAKRAFQVHGVEASGAIVIPRTRRQSRGRRPADRIALLYPDRKTALPPRLFTDHARLVIVVERELGAAL
jgi:hypothetical protein